MPDYLPIGRPGNRHDRNGRGCVPCVYEIARCAVSNGDWCAFLNAVGPDRAASLKLFHKDMSTGVLGGIDADGGRFSPKPGWVRKPVVYVTYTSLLRYCNWLTSGDTERGSYDLASDPPRRVPGAVHFLPSDDEWYKAAYFDPASNRYWRYPTLTDEPPPQSAANYEKGDSLSVGPPFYLADVDAFAGSPSPWGALQMGGNAWEFLENVRVSGTHRENTLRGGSFGYTETGLSSSNIDVGKYDCRCYVFGARIARAPGGWRPVPKPLRYRIVARVKCVLRKIRRAAHSMRIFGKANTVRSKIR